MRIARVNNYTTFTSVRQDRSTVTQLQQDNAYDLNLPNQRRITEAINELSKVQGEDNINFLLDVSENLKYGTNIDLGKKPYNDWRTRLNEAAVKSFNSSDKSIQEKLRKRLNEVIKNNKEITNEEKEILNERKILLSRIDQNSLNNIRNNNIKNLGNNLDYFIVSSEIPTSQKLYILKRLNYLMSDEYKIHPQLEDKKTRVLAEIVNDIVIDTPESKIPNIKAVNQKQHGMCAAISICRKALAYEDKPNYVDMLISELDNSEYMQVYDRSELGKHKKIPIPKADIDYDYALEKGYRIIDASAMNWMNAADTVGAFNDVIGAYATFDKENFGTFADTHIHKDIDEESAKYQDFYRACKKAKDAIITCKKIEEKQKYFSTIKKAKEKNNITQSHIDRKLATNILKQIAPEISEKDIRILLNDLTSLQVKSSDRITSLPEGKQEFAFLPNEEEEIKTEKIENYLKKVLPKNINSKILKEKTTDILDLISEINGMQQSGNNTLVQKYNKNIKLYEAAAAYRTQQVFALDINENLADMMNMYNIADNESYLIENLRTLSKNVRSGKIDSDLKNVLTKRFYNEIQERAKKDTVHSDKLLADILDEYANSVELMTTTFADEIYNSLLLGNRKSYLSTQLNGIKTEVETTKDKSIIENCALEFKTKPNRQALIQKLETYINKLEDENCTDEEFNDIMNKTGHKSNLMDIKEAFDNTYELIFINRNENYIRGFNIINGAPQDADIQTTEDLYRVLATNFNNMAMVIKTLQETLQVETSDGKILNSADPKYAVLKKLEDIGEIATEKELLGFRRKFDSYYNHKYTDNGTSIKFKDMPKYITTFTPAEKIALKKYKLNMNSWYSTSVRRLNDVYKVMKEPLEELNREVGVQKGENWVAENDSGLLSNQSIKIFEHMTDRPYYKENNNNKGLEKIKKSPYSGTSLTSVSSTNAGFHAQYVVDVKPTLLKFQDTESVKDIMFHDNTWGTAEHDNTWIDKFGLTRTDYSSSYGGELGYITNDKYLNGNIAENILDKIGKNKSNDIPTKKYKKLTNNDEEFTYPMLRGFVLPGVSPAAMSTVKTIKQNILLPSSEYVDELTEQVEKMTTNELNAAFKRIEGAGESSRELYQDLLKKITGDDTTFHKGIDSLEEYNKLKPDEKLRLVLEKVAIIKSYDDIPDINTYNIEVKSQNDLKKLQQKLRKTARDNFDYTLAKNIDILKYGTETSRKDIYTILKEFGAEKNIKITHKQMLKIVNSMKKIQPNEYDGSLNNGINLILQRFNENLKTIIGADIKEKDMSELTIKVREAIEKNFEISAADIKKSFSGGRLEKFADWIDKEFAPATDEEFAKILTDLRNMPTAEFKKLYDSKITDIDLGITELNGYDVVQKIRGGNSAFKNAFINTVFSEAYYKNVNESKIRPYYDLKKFTRNLSSGTYIGNKRTFDDLYSDFHYNLSTLAIKKEFNKYKDEAFRKYFVFPAYPLVEISSPEALENSLNTFYENIKNYMDYIHAYKNQQKSLEIMTKLKHYSYKFPKDGELTINQYKKVRLMLENVIKMNYDDETFTKQIQQAEELFDSGSLSTNEYEKIISSLYDIFKIYEKTADGKTMKEATDITVKNINTYKKTYIISLFEPKYQGKALEILNKWISAKSKAQKAKEDFAYIENEDASDLTKLIAEQLEQNIEKADEYYNQFKDLFNKHRLLETPDKYLKEYLLLCTKDAKTREITVAGNDPERAKQEIAETRETYKHNLKSLLYKADMMELQYTLMECAKNGNLNAVRDAFRTSTIELTNGTVVPMDSDEGLQIIISPMLGEENLDTAITFLNQLGLSEKMVKILTNKEAIDLAYKNFNKIQNILKKTDSQAKFARDEFRKLGNFDDNPDYENIIKKYSEDLKEKIRKTNFKDAAEIFDAAIEDTLKEIKEQPKTSKTILLGTNIDLAISGLREVVKANIEVLNEPLQVMQIRYNLIKRLQLPEGSDAVKLGEEYLENMQQLIEYEYSAKKEYPNIGIYSS